MSREAQAFWSIARGRGEIRREPLPEPGPEEALVRTLYSGISRGSETLVFAGRVPESQAASMRAPHQAGELPFPVKYGYANVGRVDAGPAALQGREVFCLYPHQDAYVVAAHELLPLPEALPPERAVLAANMETAITGLWDGAPGPGDRIAVIGAGTVGCLVAALAAGVPGCDVTLVDRQGEKAGIADGLGLGFALPEAAPQDLDLVFHASGDPGGLVTALSLAGPEARIVELSWYGDCTVGLPLGAEFHAKRLTIRSSQVSRLPPERRARWSHRRRLALALALLADSRFDLLISGESPFAELPALMQQLAGDPPGVLCHRIRYGT